MAEGVRLDLQVGLDTAYLQKELRTIGAGLTGQTIDLPVKFNRQNIVSEFRLLQRYIGGKKFNVEINTNIKSELDYARQLNVEIANLSARSVKNVAAQATGRGGGFIDEAKFNAFLKRLNQEPLKALRSGLEKAGVQMESIGNGTVEELRKSILSGLPQVSKDIAEGLIDGLDPGMKENGRKGARSLIDGFKTAAGIASPSRVFKALGKFSAEGLEIGFLDGLKDFKNKAAEEIKKIVALLKLELSSVGDINIGTEVRATPRGRRQYMSPIGPLPHGSEEPWAWNRQASRYEPYMAQPEQFRGAGIPPMRSRYPFAPVPPVMGTITSPSMFGVSRPALPPAGTAAATREAALALRELEARARSAARAATVFAEDATKAARREALQAVSGQMPLGGLPAGIRGLLPYTQPGGLPAGVRGLLPPARQQTFQASQAAAQSAQAAQSISAAINFTTNKTKVIQDLNEIIATISRAQQGSEIRLSLDSSSLQQELDTTFKKLDKQIAKQQRKLRKLEIGSPEFLARAGRSGMLQGQRERGENIAQIESLKGQALAFEPGSATALNKNMQALTLQAQQIKPNTQEWVEFQRQIGSIQTELRKADQAAEAIQLRESLGAFNTNSLNAMQAKLRLLKIDADNIQPNTPEWKKLNKEIRDLEKGIEKVNRKPLTMGQRAGAAGGAFLYGGGLGGGVGSALGGIAGGLMGGVPGAFTGAAVGQIADNLSGVTAATASYAAEIDKQRIAIRKLVPDNQQYQQSLQFIAETSKNLAIPQEQVNQGFTRIAASVIGAGGNVRDAQLAFDGIAAGIRGTGGSLQDMQGALLATAQVFSKGKVSAEELRGQIGERLPGAFTIFAQAIGKTPQELDKMLEKGEVGLNEFMVFIEALSDKYGQTALEMADSTQAAGDRLTTTMSTMREQVGRALQPLGAEFQEVFAGFIEDSTPAFVGAAQSVADAAGILAKALKEARKYIAEFGIALGALAATIITAKLPAIIAAITGAIQGLIATLAGFGTVAAIAAPWLALAAGLTAVGIAAYRASQEKKKYTEVLNKTSATSDELVSAISKAEAELAEMQARTRETGITSKATKLEIKRLKAQLEALRGRYQAIIEIKQIFTGEKGVPEGYKVIETADGPKLAYQVPGSGMGWIESETGKPITPKQSTTKFPGGTDSTQGSGRSAKADKSADRAARIQAEIQGLQRQTALVQQLSFLEELIARAQADKNENLVASLQLEGRRLELAYQLADQLAKAETQGQREALLAKARADDMRLRVGAATEAAAKEEQRQEQLQKLLTGFDREIELAGIKNDYAKELRKIEFDIIDFRKQGLLLTDKEIEAHRKRAQAALDARNAQEPVDYLQDAIDETEKNLKRLTDARYQAVEAANAIGDAFGNAFKGLVTGSMTAQEALASLFQSIADSFADMVAQMIAEWMRAQILGIFQQLLSFFSPGASAAIPSAPAPPVGAPAPPAGFANGGIAVGGFKAFATGGIVTGPTLGLVGEGRYNEAIVPLPDGRSIPVDFQGSGNGGDVNVVVNVDAKGSNVAGDNTSARELGRVISAAVQGEIVKQQRPGGLLAGRR